MEEPDEPTVSQRGTRITLLLIIGIAMLVFISTLVWMFWPRSIETEPSPAALPPGEQQVHGTFAYDGPCVDAVAGEANQGEIPDDGLPEGSQRVWLCGEPGSTVRLGPPEPLVGQRAADVVAVMNELPPFESDGCTEMYLLNYVVAVEYDDETVYLEADTTNCFNVGPTRVGAQELLEEMLTQFDEQRAEDPPGIPEVDACEVRALDTWTGINTLMPMAPADAVEASACGEPAGSTGEPVTVELGDDALAVLAAAQWSEPGSESLELGEDPLLILLRGEGGDSLSILRGADGTYVRTDSLASAMWTPDAEAAATMDAALAGLQLD